MILHNLDLEFANPLWLRWFYYKFCDNNNLQTAVTQLKCFLSLCSNLWLSNYLLSCHGNITLNVCIIKKKMFPLWYLKLRVPDIASLFFYRNKCWNATTTMVDVVMLYLCEGWTVVYKSNSCNMNRNNQLYLTTMANNCHHIIHESVAQFLSFFCKVVSRSGRCWLLL